jgi:PleD family two-component response regulator
MARSTHNGNPPVILIVDDSDINRDLVTELLSGSMECGIQQASNGSAALELIAREAPDLILLDINMPGIDGYTVCKAIRSNEKVHEIPVIFLTGQRDSEFIVKGFEAGGNDYLLKPYESRELLARVHVHLELKLQRDELKRRNRELEEAIARVKQLEGIIPICMYCKKIRNDDTMWQQFELYMGEHLDAQFTHGVCPDCFSEQLEIIKNDDGK